MSFNFEEFFKSIDIIVEQRLADLSYDKTVIATIIDDSQKANSKYIVSDGTIKFDAYTNDLNYKIDDQVRVTIMNGDWSQKKFIAGLYTDNGTNDAVTYVPPLNNVFQNEYAKNNVNTSFELMANGDIISKPIWGKHIVPGSSEYILQAEGIYNVITLSGDFKTDLGNLSAGGYGLRLDLYIQGQTEDERIVKFVTFDSSEMIGNPYSFIIDSRQEKQIAIAAEGIVTEIVLSVYQGVSYNNEGSATDNLFYDKNGNLIEEKPIYFNNITIGFGSNLNEIADNKLQIYTLNSATYKYNGGNGDETNDKSLGLVWYNKTDSNEYIGFSDGIYDPSYDEINYLKNSYADSRLTKNIGKSSVANDELSLTLAANIEESEPFMTSAYEALTTKLSSVLQALGNQIPGTSFLEKLIPLISSYVDEEGKNQPALLVQYRDKAERNVQNLVSLYQDILQYGYNIQNGLEATWGSIEDVEWGKENYYQNFLDAIQQAIQDVENFFQDMKAGTENDQPMAGYRGIYNPYQLRIDREIKAIELTLNQIISSSAVYGSAKIDDFTWLIGYKDKTKDDMPSYVKDDLSEFNNKYCIYWYRYNEGYKMQYIVPMSEEEWNALSDDKKQYSTYDEYLNACKNNNIEYQFGQFFDSNWERVRVDKNNNPIINFGLPLTKGDSIDGINYFIKSPLKEQLLERKMDPKTESERYQAILFYNHERYNSNILTFINTQADEIPPEFAVDAADVIRIEHDVYSQDHYQIYSSANDLVNIADASRIRQLKCFYDGVLVGDEALAGAGLYWYIPINSTMLTYDKKYLIDRGFVTDADGTTSLSKPGYIYFYKEVGFTTETVELKDSAGQPVLDFEGKPVIENKIIINEPDKYFFYKVKSYYEASAQNNTILVEAHLENNEKEKITTGEIAFTFGTFGTNGTKYTLSIVPNTTQIAVLPQSGDNPPLTLTLSLRDANGDLLTVNEDIVNIPTDEPEQFVAYDLTVDWWAKDDQVEQQVSLSNIEDSKSKLITISNEYDADFRYAGIVKGSVSFDEELSDGSNRRINLDTMYPVPFSSSPDYYISGPTMIVYNNQGTVSRLSEEPYKLFQHTLDGDVEVKGCSWELKYYDNFGKLIDTYDQTKYDAILAYMPKLNQDNTLMSAPMYCAFDDGSFIVPVAICKNENNDIVWSQPIIIIQNNYASSTLNDWNGQFEINEANGTILSTMIGAGKKNDNNTFDGVLMGDIEAGANFDTDNASGLGLYGFNDGAQSFHFGVDGRAFLGKAGRGRIIFDGNSGSISSASYEQQRVPIYETDENGKSILIGYKNNSTAGMMIDLDDGFIDMLGTVKDEQSGEYLPEKGASGNQSNVHIDVKSPYFKIRSIAGNDIIKIANDSYYLQSDHYKAATFSTPSADVNANEVENGQGMLIDLMKGTINAYQFSLASKNILLNAGDSASDYLSVRDNNGKVLMYLGDNAQFLKSSDYVQYKDDFPGMGMRLNLKDGSLEAYDFKLRAGAYDSDDDGLKDDGFSIEINSSGSPYLSITSSSGQSLINFSNTEQYLQSISYKEGESGVRFDLQNQYLKAYGKFEINATKTAKKEYIILSTAETAQPLQIGNNFKVSWAGSITAEGGTFNNITVNNGTFTGNLEVDGIFDGGIIVGAAIFAKTLDIGYSSGTRAISAPSAGSGKFSVTSGGDLTIGDSFSVTSAGRITATSGEIGGWEVSETKFANSAGTVSLGVDGLVDQEGITSFKNLLATNSFTVQGANSDQVFYVDSSGNISMSGNIEMDGSLTFDGTICVGEKAATAFGAGGEGTDILIDTPWSSKTWTATFINGILTNFTSAASTTTLATWLVQELPGVAKLLGITASSGGGDGGEGGSTTTVATPKNVGASLNPMFVKDYNFTACGFSMPAAPATSGNTFLKFGTSGNDSYTTEWQTLYAPTTPGGANQVWASKYVASSSGNVPGWCSIEATLVNFTDATTVEGPYTSGGNTYYNVKVDYDKSGTVTAPAQSGSVTATYPGYWLCWNSDSTGGRIYSTELSASQVSESYVKSNYKYYTYAQSRKYTVPYVTEAQDITYEASGTTTGKVQIEISLS